MNDLKLSFVTHTASPTADAWPDGWSQPAGTTANGRSQPTGTTDDSTTTTTTTTTTAAAAKPNDATAGTSCRGDDGTTLSGGPATGVCVGGQGK